MGATPRLRSRENRYKAELAPWRGTQGKVTAGQGSLAVNGVLAKGLTRPPDTGRSAAKRAQHRPSRAVSQASSRSGKRREQITFVCTVLGTVATVLALILPALPIAPVKISPSMNRRNIAVVNTNLQARPCIEAGALRSSSYGHKTVVQFINREPAAIRLYWIDYQGTRELYGNLSPGESVEFDTYVTHPWLVANALGQCIAIFLPAKEPGRAVIQ
jgi:von Hippel-Lindau disease tumor suppressor protein